MDQLTPHDPEKTDRTSDRTSERTNHDQVSAPERVGSKATLREALTALESAIGKWDELEREVLSIESLETPGVGPAANRSSGQTPPSQELRKTRELLIDLKRQIDALSQRR